MFQKILFWIFVVKVAAALPGVYIDRGGNVGASWGGYSASAGLGGLLGGGGPQGGLHAQAGTPDGHFASAGLGGSVSEGAGPQGQLYSSAGQIQPEVVATGDSASQAQASASASASATSSASASSQGGAPGFVAGPPVVKKHPGSFFDDIFNIPISTLGAVNQYLNNRNRGVLRLRPVQVSQPDSNAYASSSASSSSASSSSASATASADAGTPGRIDNNISHGYGYYVKGAPNYNDIFNIPISVLGAVNRFLNGK